MFKPLNGYILVKRDVEKVTKGGIVLTDASKARDNSVTTGKIVAIADDIIEEIKSTKAFHVGQTTYFSPMLAFNVKIEAEEFMLIRAKDIFGVLA